ncbi:hypothetical protein GEMRC1_007799 [Eukaryota sp. GEM-RC1]
MLPSLLFQVQRAHMIKAHASVLGNNVSDKMILELANNLVQSVGGTPIASIRDRTLSNGKMSRQVMKESEESEDKIMNARYVLTMMRKLCSSVIFASDEHIVDLNGKFINSILIAVIGQHMANEKKRSKLYCI